MCNNTGPVSISLLLYSAELALRCMAPLGLLVVSKTKDDIGGIFSPLVLGRDRAATALVEP